MQHNRIFSTEDTTIPGLITMPRWLGMYDPAHPEQIPILGQQLADLQCGYVSRLQPSERCIFLRWVLNYETIPALGADPLAIFSNGGLKLSRTIAFLRPYGRELRRRGLTLDGIWGDSETALSNWNLTPAQINAIYASPSARAKMPPGVKALRPQQIYEMNPDYVRAVTLFNRWASHLCWSSYRRALVDSGVLRVPSVPGGPNVQPPTMNFAVFAPTFPVYDNNGWQIFSYSLDGKASSPGLYFSSGGRYGWPRVHAPLWNILIDHINFIRSCMRRPGASVWPTIPWPDRTNRWVWEQMVAHMVRTGMNWTSNKSGYIYWQDPPLMNQATQGPLVVDIFNRHDQPFPVQRNLPEIPLDSDRIETAGYATTYADFLDNVGP